jgi:hypothetical protein
MKYRPTLFEFERRDLLSTTWNIGPGYTYTAPDQFGFNTTAQDGDTIDIYPNIVGGQNMPYYDRFGISRIDHAHLLIRGITVNGNTPIMAEDGSDPINSDYQPAVATSEDTIVFNASSRTAQVQNVTVKNLILQGIDSGPDANDIIGVGLYDAAYITLQGLNVQHYFDGIFGKSDGNQQYGDLGVPDQPSSGIQIIGCTLNNNGELVSPYSHGHSVYVEGWYTTYKNNVIGPNDSGGAGIKDRSYGPTVAYNWVSGALPLNMIEPADGWITMGTHSGFGVEYIYGNIISGGDSEDMWLGSDGSDSYGGYQPGPFYIYNNTVANTAVKPFGAEGIAIQGGTSTSPVVVDLSDNIFSIDSGTPNLTVLAAKYGMYDTAVTHFGANVFPTSVIKVDGYAVNFTYDGWDSTVNNVIQADPQYNNYAAGDYRVQGTSPAVNATMGLFLSDSQGFETLQQAGLTVPAQEYAFGSTDPAFAFSRRFGVTTLGGWEYFVPHGPTGPSPASLGQVFSHHHEDLFGLV